MFEPWPDDAAQSWRERYLAAFHSIGEDALQAAALFQRLAEEREDDPVVGYSRTGRGMRSLTG